MAITRASRPVNNAIYDELDERWYEAQDDPIALLRAESACRTPWIAEQIQARFGARASVLDIACGAGFLSNAVAREGHAVTGIDASERGLAVAARQDSTHSVRYVLGDALQQPFEGESFDVACAMDFLEHVENPDAVVAEAARVLVPGGLFFFHTFNRTFWAWLVVIKGVEWFVKNTPRDLHAFRLFLTPGELRSMCAAHRMTVHELRGLEPAFPSAALVRLMLSGTVPKDFAFRFTKSTSTGYTGVAVKER